MVKTEEMFLEVGDKNYELIVITDFCNALPEEDWAIAVFYMKNEDIEDVLNNYEDYYYEYDGREHDWIDFSNLDREAPKGYKVVGAVGGPWSEYDDYMWSADCYIYDQYGEGIENFKEYWTVCPLRSDEYMDLGDFSSLVERKNIDGYLCGVIDISEENMKFRAEWVYPLDLPEYHPDYRRMKLQEIDDEQTRNAWWDYVSDREDYYRDLS